MPELDQNRRAMQVFMQVCSADPATWPGLLDECCGDDVSLRAKVEQMLAADAQKSTVSPIAEGRIDQFLAAQVREIDPEVSADTLQAESPEVEGSYRILRVIGEGGMGTVYEAEQLNPRRRVAIKAIRPGRITPQMRRRFEMEAQLLGRLQHPGIARLYEADTEAVDGTVRGYLAMELVEGKPIDDYVRTNQLNPAATLRLFIKLCDAVQYAHRMGVIHRDLKPPNILVDSEGQPRVLDFGVARTVGEGAQTGAASLTMGGQIVGTLAYMSPEQMDGRKDVDTRCDVYALGVILYKILTGSLPIDLSHDSLPAAVRRVSTEQPPPPSKLDRRLLGDLDVIVLKALEKDANRRYASVQILSDELHRYLDGRPIEARGDSAIYILRKTVWRHRWPFATAMTLFVTVSILAVFAFSQARHSDRMAREAIQARAEAQQRELAAVNALYLSNTALAQAALETSDLVRARNLLEVCDPKLRGWEWRYLLNQCDQSDTTRRLGRHGIRSAEISHDLKTAVVSDGFKQCSVIDLASGASRTIGNTSGVSDYAVVALNEDGKRIAAAEVLGDLRVYDAGSGSVIWSVDAAGLRADRRVRALRFSPDGHYLAAGLGGAQVCVWDAASGKLVAEQTLNVVGINALAFSADSRRLSFADSFGTIRSMDVAAADAFRTIAPLESSIGAIELDDSRNRLAVGYLIGKVLVINTETGETERELVGNWERVTRLQFSPDGRRLLAVCSDSSLRLFDLETGVSQGFFGHLGPVMSARIVDATTVLSVGADGTLKTWSLAQSKFTAMQVDPQSTWGLSFTSDGRRLLVGGSNGDVHEIQLHGGGPVVTRGIGHVRRVYSVETDPTGDTVVSAGMASEIKAWHRDSGTIINQFRGHRGSVVGLRLFGQRMISSDSAGEYRLWDRATGDSLASGKSDRNWAGVPDVSPDKTRFAVGGRAGYVRVYSTTDGTQIDEIQLEEGQVNAVAFSPDGSRLAAATASGAIVELATGSPLRVVRRWQAHDAAVLDVAYHPTEPRLASGGQDRAVTIWNLENGGNMLTHRRHRREVSRVRFSPDGDYLASSGADGMVYLLDAGRKAEQ